MKSFSSILFISTLLTFMACSNNNSTQASNKNNDSTSQIVTSNNVETKEQSSLNRVITDYLSLKNALANDNGKDAANAGDQISNALSNIDEASLSPEQKKVYNDVKDDMKENAEHIGSNGSNIAHQREHFDHLSDDMIDFVKATGSPQTLYKDFCPMYNNKKGAYWLSETKDIRNPFYGKQMPKCGEIKEEIKSKGSVK